MLALFGKSCIYTIFCYAFFFVRLLMLRGLLQYTFLHLKNRSKNKDPKNILVVCHIVSIQDSTSHLDHFIYRFTNSNSFIPCYLNTVITINLDFFFQLKNVTGKSLSEALFQNMGRTCCVQKLFWMSETISVHNMTSQGLSLEFSCIELVIQWTICRHIVG